MTIVEHGMSLQALVDGVPYPAEPIAGGAAYEIFHAQPTPGFLPTTSASRWPYHRFVPASEVITLGEPPTQPNLPESALTVPLTRRLTWEKIHRLSQQPARDPASAALIGAVRASATIRRGTRMVAPMTPQTVAAVLRGGLPHGFCYREWDIAHLRTPAELAVLSGQTNPDVAFALRWRAIDASDYQAPVGAGVHGMVTMPPHDRVGAQVLGTGFAPSSAELIPEWITRDLADLPLPANASLVAYTPDGSEVVLFTFQPEQRGWLRLVGPQWRHLLASIRDVSADQEYIPLPRDTSLHSRLVGAFRGDEYPAVADPPDEFRVLAMTRAARYQVEALVRRTRYATWRDARCTVVGADSSWMRLRLTCPDPANVAALGAQCYERGIYEAWAPANEVVDIEDADLRYF